MRRILKIKLSVCFTSAFVIGLSGARAGDKSGVSPNVISLPSGPGSIEGLGASFDPLLSTGVGTAAFSVEVPPGTGGLVPEVRFSYNSGNPNGVLGMGWAFSCVEIRRQTDRGMPTYGPGNADTFLYNGEEVVPIADGTFRCRNETAFVRLHPVSAAGQPVDVASPDAVGWEATRPNGTRMLFGLTSQTKVVNPYMSSGPGDARFDVTFKWLLSAMIDPSGNAISYSYAPGPSTDIAPYLAEVEYGKFGAHSHTVTFEYSPAPNTPGCRKDAISDFRPGFEVRTSIRMTTVTVSTDGQLVRRYGFKYDGSEDLGMVGDLASFSFLRIVTQFDNSGNSLPPIQFGYSSGGIISPPVHWVKPGGIADLVSADQYEVADINGDGLPDYVSGTARTPDWTAFLNTGHDEFTSAVTIHNTPSGLSLFDNQVSLADVNGDGIIDVVSREPSRIVYFANGSTSSSAILPVEPSALRFEPQSVLVPPTQNPPFGTYNDPSLGILDLDFDKRSDVLAPFLQGVVCYLNRREGWQELQVRQISGDLPEDWTYDEARFDLASDFRRADLADMNGDRLLDWVVLRRELLGALRVSYWPNAGKGRFVGPRRFIGSTIALPPEAILADLELMDVNHDGLTDLVLPFGRQVSIWVHLPDDTWSIPITKVAPYFNRDFTKLRAMDINGNGTIDLVWNNHNNLELAGDGNGDGRIDISDAIAYIDFMGDLRPNLLTLLDNGLGTQTHITYKSSISDYLRASDSGAAWTTKAPFATPVVKRVSVDVGLDLDNDGDSDEYITDYNYRDAAYNGPEDEFRGFGFVEEIERGDDYSSATGLTEAGTGVVSGPSLVKRFRYITGLPDGADNDDYPSTYSGVSATDESPGTGEPVDPINPDIGGTEEEALAGCVLFSEIIDPAVLVSGETVSFDGAARAAALAPVGAAASLRCTDDNYVFSRTVNSWRIRRLYRPAGVTNPPGRFPDEALVAKSVSFPILMAADTQVIEANGYLKNHLSHVVAYPAASPVSTRSNFDYDDFGNLVRDADFGIVDGANIAVGHDERITLRQYALGGQALSRWIIDHVSVDRVEDSSAVFAKESRHYYDGPEFEGLPSGQMGSRGLLKRTEEIVTDDQSAVLQIAAYDPVRINGAGDPRLPSRTAVETLRVAHDIYGNTLASVDPLGSPSDVQLLPDAAAPLSASINASSSGHIRLLAYDVNRHAFPISETIVVGGGKPDLTVSATYDAGFGTMTSFTDFNGFVTFVNYDSFGRCVSRISPDDTPQFPSVSYHYRLADPRRSLYYDYDASGQLTLLSASPSERVASSFTTRRRETAGQPGTVDSVKFTGPLGQTLMMLDEDETAGQWVVSQATLFNGRGQSSAVYDPYYVALPQPACLLPGANGFQKDGNAISPLNRSDTFADPLAREILRLSPPETTSTILRSQQINQYLPFENREFDEEDCNPTSDHYDTPHVMNFDGLKRTIRVDEVVRLNDDGTTAGIPATWATSYSYDPRGLLTSYTDSQNNTCWNRYDGLGRRFFQNHVDAGLMEASFDSASNVSRTVDARGYEIDYSYDGANRILTEDYLDDALPYSAHRAPDVEYHYDQAAGVIDFGDRTTGTAENVRGHLAWVRDLTGEEHLSHDGRGRIEWNVKRIADPVTQALVSYCSATTYDSMDRIASIIYPDGDRVSQEFNSRGGLKTIVGGGSQNLNSDPNLVEGVAYEASGQCEGFTYGNGIKTKYGYDPRQRTNSLQAAPTSASNLPMLAYSYLFDSASNILRINDDRAGTVLSEGNVLRNTQVFKYDSLYRLTGVQYSFALPGRPISDDGSISYRYDRIGNMLEQKSSILHSEAGLSVTNLGMMSYGGAQGRSNRTGRTNSDPGPHAFVASSGGRSMGYDAVGNVSNSDGIQCTWDFPNHLVSATGATFQADYHYDYAGRRISKQTRSRLSSVVSTATLYVSPDFEVRQNDQPVKYVFIGDQRIVRATGSFDSSVQRVQRLSLYRGWNLISTGVSLANAPSQFSDSAIAAVNVRDTVSGQFRSLLSGEDLPQESLVWLKLTQPATIAIVGSTVEPQGAVHAIPAGGSYLVSPGLTAMHLGDDLQGISSLWQFDGRDQSWQPRLPALLATLSDFTRVSPVLPLYAFAPTVMNISVPGPDERIQYFHADHLGSTNLVTDAKGKVVQNTVYYPFGATRSEQRNAVTLEKDYGFSGKERDEESRFSQFEARYDSTVMARFCAVDSALITLSGAATDPQLLNGYSYTANRPLSFTDNSGRAPTGAKEVSGAIYSGLGNRKDQKKSNPGKPVNRVRIAAQIGVDLLGAAAAIALPEAIVVEVALAVTGNLAGKLIDKGIATGKRPTLSREDIKEAVLGAIGGSIAGNMFKPLVNAAKRLGKVAQGATEAAQGAAEALAKEITGAMGSSSASRGGGGGRDRESKSGSKGQGSQKESPGSPDKGQGPQKQSSGATDWTTGPPGNEVNQGPGENTIGKETSNETQGNDGNETQGNDGGED